MSSSQWLLEAKGVKTQAGQSDLGSEPEVPTTGMGQGECSVCRAGRGEEGGLGPPQGSGISQVGNGLTANKKAA